ncbi:hypothetical protein Tco_0495085, partial [Tanacetum coccineum]
VDSETLRQTYIPKWNVTNDSDLVLFSQLCSIDYEQLFIEFNVEAARQTRLSSKVRLRLKHELRGRKRF